MIFSIFEVLIMPDEKQKILHPTIHHIYNVGLNFHKEELSTAIALT
jgi:hypothetical protein